MSDAAEKVTEKVLSPRRGGQDEKQQGPFSSEGAAGPASTSSAEIRAGKEPMEPTPPVRSGWGCLPRYPMGLCQEATLQRECSRPRWEPCGLCALVNRAGQ